MHQQCTHSAVHLFSSNRACVPCCDEGQWSSLWMDGVSGVRLDRRIQPQLMLCICPSCEAANWYGGALVVFVLLHVYGAMSMAAFPTGQGICNCTVWCKCV